MLYQIMNGTVSCGGQEILSHIDFEIKGKEKIAIVGANGAGKTTLLKLIAREFTLDRDDKREGPGIFACRNLTVGMLSQVPKVDMELTVSELFGLSTLKLMNSTGNEVKASLDESDTKVKAKSTLLDTCKPWEFDKLFTGFGFTMEEKNKKLNQFSGGEQTKIFMISLLLSKPDILLLDEPTNHLDIETVEWLEKYLKKYEKAVVMVSHDRFFLDQVADVVYELNHGKLKKYVGTYTQYRKKKKEDLILQKKAYERDQAELERLNALIDKFKNKPKKASFARSRQTLINRMKLTEKPEEEETYHFTTPIEPAILGSKWVVEGEHLKIGYEAVLLELSLRVKRGQKIGIIGDNGVGKSTFLKTVAGKIPKLDGKLTLGNNTTMGYFDQHTASVESKSNVYDHFHELFPGMLEKDARNLLASFLFKGNDVMKNVSDLSGGEKSRLLLAEMLTEKPNLLLLDEPTNHMDIRAKENLESAFIAYTGTILFVSHDRYFINQVADALLVFSKDSVMFYPFSYEHYLNRKTISEDGSIAAMIEAEDQALIAGLRGVPKAERHETPQMTTEEAHLDWKLGLSYGPMKEAEERFSKAFEEAFYKEQQELFFAWRAYSKRHFGEEDEASWKYFLKEMQEGLLSFTKDYRGMADVIDAEGELGDLWNVWTDQCLSWYENLLPDEDVE